MAIVERRKAQLRDQVSLKHIGAESKIEALLVSAKSPAVSPVVFVHCEVQSLVRLAS